MWASSSLSTWRPCPRRMSTARPWYSVAQHTIALVTTVSQAPHLFGLLLVVAPLQRALVGVGEVAFQSVHVLALVQLAADTPSIGLVGEIASGVDASAKRPVFLDRGGERVLPAFRRTQFADHQRRGGVPSMHRRGDAKQVVPTLGDQLGVQAPGQQRSRGWATAVRRPLPNRDP